MHPSCASLLMTCAMASSFCLLVAGCRCVMRLKHMCWGRKAALGRSSCWCQILEQSHSSCIPVAAGTEPGGRVVWGDGFEGLGDRSEERRVGKECRSRWSPYH